MSTTTDSEAGTDVVPTGTGGKRGSWWSRVPRAVKLTVAIAFVIFLILLPIIEVPWLSTNTEINLGFTTLEKSPQAFSLVLAEFARYGLVALGLNIVVGLAGLLDLGYVGFFAVGAYVVALLSSPDSDLKLRLAWLACVPFAIIVTSLSGILLGLPTLRLRGDYLAIVTLGFGEIVRLLADNLDVLRGNTGLSNVAFPVIGASATAKNGLFSNGNITPPFDYGTMWYWLGLVAIALVLWATWNLERSRVGRAWVALREDEDAAEIMGVPTFRFKLWAFALGAAIGGLAGAFMVGQVQFVNNQKFDVLTSVLFLAAVVIGGQGNKFGVLLGAFLIVYIPARFADIASWKLLIFGLIMILLMLFRPQGLIPAKLKLIGVRSRLAQPHAVAREPEQPPDSGPTTVNVGGDLT